MNLKLNLGSGNRPLRGYINIDLYSPLANVCLDLTQKLPFSDNSIQEINADHLIEHFSILEWRRIKKDWFRILEPGGFLIIGCPDIDRWLKRFLDNSEGRKWSYWIIGIYGSQEPTGPGQFHKNGFNLAKLTSDLEEEGFNVIEHSWRYDETPDPDGFNLFLKASK